MTIANKELKSFYCDVLVTAIESGIGYWADVKDYDWKEDNDGNMIAVSAMVKLTNEDDEEDILKGWHPLTPELVRTGIARILREKESYGKEFRAMVYADKQDRDACNIDANDADVIVQVGLFGKEIFA